MNPRQPVIGIISHKQQINGREYGAIYFNYMEAILDAGGIPILIGQFDDENYIKQVLDTIDGLLIPGGVDIHPKFYQEPILKQCGAIDEALDRFELHVMKLARIRGIPILGICRGLQLINVAYGGSLYQDISYYPHNDETVVHAQDRYRLPQHEAVHSVTIKQDSKLFDAYGNETIMVNSFHHQFIKDCAKDLEVVAIAPDGIIEAVESKVDPFVVGVQWHPEKMFHKDPVQRKLFHYFIEHAIKYRQKVYKSDK